MHICDVYKHCCTSQGNSYGKDGFLSTGLRNSKDDRSVLQCIAECWSVLQCFAECCSERQLPEHQPLQLERRQVYVAVWQTVAACCRVARYMAVCCSGAEWDGFLSIGTRYPKDDGSMLQCVAVCSRIVQYVTVCSNMFRLFQCATACDGSLGTGRKSKDGRSVLQRVAACCSMLQCNVECGSMRRHPEYRPPQLKGRQVCVAVCRKVV